jgi:hypothetical protein
MASFNKGNDIGWFEAGSAAYLDGGRDVALFPPLGDREAQRAWLGGFGATWAETRVNGESVAEALIRTLAGSEELLRQLWSHRTGWGSREVH